MSKQKNLIVVLFIAIMALALAACNAAQAGGTAAPAAQTGSTASAGGITVVGQGTAYGQPDQATVVVGVESFAATVAEATTQNQTTLESVMAALTAAGIAAEDIQTTNYSLFAEQTYSESGPTGIAGYRVSNQVNVKIRDIELVGDVLAAVTEAGANSIYNINFSVADPVALEAEARALAMQDAANRAASLAELGNVSLGEITVISEVIGAPVMPYGGSYAVAESASAAPGISPGQLSYQVQVQVTYSIQ